MKMSIVVTAATENNLHKKLSEELLKSGLSQGAGQCTGAGALSCGTA